MARFFEQKISCDKLKQITLANGQVIGGGARSRWSVTVNERMKWSVTVNEIYGVRDLILKNPTNAGEVDTEEYQHGDNHTGTVTVSDDFSEVTFAISNPCGAETLQMEFTLFSKFPIMHDMVAVEVGEQWSRYQ